MGAIRPIDARIPLCHANCPDQARRNSRNPHVHFALKSGSGRADDRSVTSTGSLARVVLVGVQERSSRGRYDDVAELPRHTAA